MALLLLFPVVTDGCTRREAEPRNLPDTVLRDSLGLGDRDRVHRIRLEVASGTFTVAPTRLEVPRGVWVEFVTADGWPRTVSFELDSLPEAAVELFRSTGQDRSPPLLEAGARFLVHLRGVPSGRYPYLVEGSGRPTRGVVVVTDPEGGG